MRRHVFRLGRGREIIGRLGAIHDPLDSGIAPRGKRAGGIAFAIGFNQIEVPNGASERFLNRAGIEGRTSAKRMMRGEWKFSLVGADIGNSDTAARI